MIVKTKAFADRRAYIGSVGRAGENAVRALEIDCADVLAEYPDAEIIAVIRRAQGDPYTVALEKDGAVRRLVFLEADYKYPGRLEIELRAIDGERILKSAIYAATVEESIQGESDTPGQPVRDVLDRLETEIAAAQAVVDDIRQKLDSGAFKGDKGDKGDKGEPGRDATIIPATNAEINTHTDAAHVLAPSNMDYAVKAAMTDGKGAAWTAAEQQAARDRMGVPGEFELIEEITLSEDVKSVGREAFPDGTPYNLRSLIITVDSTNVKNATNVSGWVRLNAKLPLSEWAYISTGIFASANELLSFFVYRVLSDGSVDSYFTNAVNAMATAYTTTRLYIPRNVIRFGMHINDFLLYATENAVIPANTKISIYGVRA